MVKRIASHKHPPVSVRGSFVGVVLSDDIVDLFAGRTLCVEFYNRLGLEECERTQFLCLFFYDPKSPV
jgi:hypothetical protein